MQVINFRSPIHNTTSQSTRATADHDYDIPLFIFYDNRNLSRQRRWNLCAQE